MKCNGCYLQSTGKDLQDNEVKYCIGSPDHEPKYGSEKVVTTERLILAYGGPIYRANDDDECHLWSSDRFNKELIK